MDLSGIVLYDGIRHYRICTWNGDYLIPWTLDRDPTFEEAQAAINAWWNYGWTNDAGIKKFY